MLVKKDGLNDIRKKRRYAHEQTTGLCAAWSAEVRSKMR